VGLETGRRCLPLEKVKKKRKIDDAGTSKPPDRLPIILSVPLLLLLLHSDPAIIYDPLDAAQVEETVRAEQQRGRLRFGRLLAVLVDDG